MYDLCHEERIHTVQGGGYDPHSGEEKVTVVPALGGQFPLQMSVHFKRVQRHEARWDRCVISLAPAPGARRGLGPSSVRPPCRHEAANWNKPDQSSVRGSSDSSTAVALLVASCLMTTNF
ncbi:unnamed protein product [Pleuronectes platessa]|uniref:Uncharacterized protein n=1 Tax=Pleuronectes platessa TaxID=8262 RepID=A0A9N7UI68_PLEPL|nr:unnamed protein product [Pleuronectes platessa]